jgi:hypothetical protein
VDVKNRIGPISLSVKNLIFFVFRCGSSRAVLGEQTHHVKGGALFIALHNQLPPALIARTVSTNESCGNVRSRYAMSHPGPERRLVPALTWSRLGAKLPRQLITAAAVRDPGCVKTQKTKKRQE